MSQENERFGRQFRDAASQVATKSIMNPLLWLDAIIGLPAFVMSLNSSEPYKFWFFLVGVFCLVVTMGFYALNWFFDRDRLQSEDFRLRDREITVFGDSTNPIREAKRIENGKLLTSEMLARSEGKSDV